MRYCPECGEEINGNPKFCAQCGEELSKKSSMQKEQPIEKIHSPAIKQAEASWDTWNKKHEQEKQKSKIGYLVLGIVGFILICVLLSTVPGIVTNNIVPGGGQNPDVIMENCNGHTGWDLSMGYYATFDVTVKNAGNGWAVATYAQVQVQDQNGNIKYNDYILDIGYKNPDGSYSPMEIGEEHAFSFKVDYNMGDSSLSANIKIIWQNKNGNQFSHTYSKILYL